MSAATAPVPPAEQHLAPDTVELHVRNVPRTVWLKARQAALASGLRFGQYVIKLLEQAQPPRGSTATDPSAISGVTHSRAEAPPLNATVLSSHSW